MRKLSLFIAAVALFTSCTRQQSKPAPGSELGFAISFFQNVNDEVDYGENVIVSPYSAGVALSMLEPGAGGKTKVELQETLNGCIFQSQDLGSSESLTVKSANSIWLDDSFRLRDKYQATLQKGFDAQVSTLDFAEKSAVETINRWCSDNTEGKIDGIVDQLFPGDMMVLLNALYFDAPWAKSFDEKFTHEDVFFSPCGDQKTPMMSIKSDFLYASYLGCQMIQLPYEGERYSMFVVLPPAGMDINAMIPYISEAAYKEAMEMLSVKNVQFTMPKFKLETSMILNDALQDMGMKTAFSSKADFSNISPMGPLQISLVKQKCYIDVSEEGTEAAAVTSVQVRLTAVRPDAPQVMKVDRPFIFFIADSQTDNLLFVGKIMTLE